MKHLPRRERRQRIVLGAMEAFATSGFQGTRSRDVAKAAGVSEALIFKHFPNKRAFQKAIIEERISRPGEFLSAELKAAPLEKAMTMITTRIFQVSERDPHFMRLLYFAGLEGDPLAPLFFERRVAGSIDEVAGLFRLWARGAACTCGPEGGRSHRRPDPVDALPLFAVPAAHAMFEDVKSLLGLGRKPAAASPEEAPAPSAPGTT